MRIDRSDEPGVVRLALHGELDLATADLLDRAVTAVLAEPPPQLVLDLADLTFCDSAGLDALLTARAGAFARDVRLRAVGARGIVHRTMTVTGLLELLS
ncbi:STAS domain-containing protein [Actinoplanes sp. L3-i22]|uniref:STAS domain-containing protein n=1 Tax=Actinoplanes sp. L3-i22 TaxID=2836373 RepID=UPI001C75645F|nr:STAS domain-containing protein [Actinoplanes sp. L3-i22]BCY07588.1 hypothetical protein L3i22_026760 [Actinoplanes sp. L3-i22]